MVKNMFAAVNSFINNASLLLVISFVSFICLCWGFDNLRVSIFSGELATFTMDEIENNGIGNKRYIKVTNAVWDGSYVCQVTQDSGYKAPLPGSSVERIEYPLLSSNDVEKLRNKESFEVKVIVFKNVGGKLEYRDVRDWVEKNIAIGKTADVEGVTRVGLDPGSNNLKQLLQSLNMKISEDVIFVEDGKKPNSVVWGLSLLAISAATGLLALFFGFGWIRLLTKK